MGNLERKGDMGESEAKECEEYFERCKTDFANIVDRLARIIKEGNKKEFALLSIWLSARMAATIDFLIEQHPGESRPLQMFELVFGLLQAMLLADVNSGDMDALTKHTLRLKDMTRSAWNHLTLNLRPDKETGNA